MFLPAFQQCRCSATRHDGARAADWATAQLAFTTDSYVVRPLFFPGGDIGTLAVNGTVNDLAMCGARPLYLSAGFILEEGLPMETLRRVVAVDAGRRRTPRASQIVTGDTKVVDRGKGDGLFINTAGVGVIEHGRGDRARERAAGRRGPAVSGDLGRHGMAIMAVREGLEFESADRERLRAAGRAGRWRCSTRGIECTACAT